MVSLHRSLLVLFVAAALALSGCTTDEGKGSQTTASDGGTNASSSASSSATATESATPSSTPTPTPTPTPEPIELPRGGMKVFPDYRLVGYSGHPHAPGMGRLGIGNLEDRLAEMEQTAVPYAGQRKVLPVLELITTVVQAAPGADGLFRSHTDDEIIRDYLDAARRHDALLLLNIQPGRSSMTAEVERLGKWLKEPDVGIALDPEWDIGPGQFPGAVYGNTDGAEINQIATYLDSIVTKNDLPQKVLVYHQVAAGVVTNAGAITAHPGVAVVQSVDGIGSPEMKTGTYNAVMAGKPSTVHAGFKLFFEEDVVLGPLMTPAEVLALKPQPEYVLYE